MNLLPKSHTDFSQKEYWNSFFAKRGNKAFEWYGEYPELCEQIHKYVKVKDDILVIGCGNSNLSMDMYDIGFNKITNIDISKVVIRQMKVNNAKKRPDMIFKQMDVLNTTFEDESFSVIIDKGTLDALMPNSEQEVVQQIDKMFKEIQRILKFGGRYLCVSLLQEHILKQLLDYFPKQNWMFRVVRCYEVERKTKENGENSLPVFFVVCTKFKQLSSTILESCLAGISFIRHRNIEDLISAINTVQQAALVCSGLRRGVMGDKGDEVIFELCEPGAQSSRYTVYVLESEKRAKSGVYAAFIVPQGRETEWIFSTKPGRRHLIKSVDFGRLAVITMHRGQEYKNLDAVKEELCSTVLNFAPPNIPKSIPYLSLGDDVGKREIRYEGKSEFSGEFVIEDVTNESGEIYRRLIFLSNRNIIQSEAKLKQVKSRNGKLQLNPDPTYLCCNHHVYMTLGLNIATLEASSKDSHSLLIGLGGGGLCSFLNRALPHMTLTVVDIDEEVVKIAKQWFGLQEKQGLELIVKDGLEIIEEQAKQETKYKAVLFDVDSKDTSLGMSCPPKEFLEDNVLKNVSSLIGNNGIFILNLILRDETLRETFISKLKSNFTSIISYQLEDDLNEVLYCRNVNNEKWQDELKEAAENLNAIMKKRKIQNNEFIDISALMDGLKLCT